MAEKKKRSSLGRDLKKFETVGGNPQKMYQGERPGQPDPAVLAKIKKRAERVAKKITAEQRMYLEAYAEKKNHADAWRVFNPTCPTVESARRKGWEFMRKIRESLSEDEIYDLLGLSREAITTAIADALAATSQRDFILPKTGQIISTPPVAAHETRLAAASLGAKVRKMVGDPEDKPQQLIVNLIEYCPPGTPIWPGGGRPEPSYPPGTIVRRGPYTPALPAKADITGRDPSVRED